MEEIIYNGDVHHYDIGEIGDTTVSVIVDGALVEVEWDGADTVGDVVRRALEEVELWCSGNGDLMCLNIPGCYVGIERLLRRVRGRALCKLFGWWRWV